VTKYGHRMTEYLEALMLTAFSVSWYCSIWKMLRTGQASGKSLGFVLLICLGYVAGIASKLVIWSQTGIMPNLIYLYTWNLVVTGIDAWLVLTLSRLPRPPVPSFFRLRGSFAEFKFGRTSVEDDPIGR